MQDNYTNPYTLAAECVRARGNEPASGKCDKCGARAKRLIVLCAADSLVWTYCSTKCVHADATAEFFDADGA